MKRRIPTLTLLSICALLTGCAVGPDYRRPATETPARFKNAAPAQTSSPASTPDDWWTLFQDPELNDLIRQVDVSNQNLAQAIAAYDQAEAAVRAARAAFFPTVAADATATRIG